MWKTLQNSFDCPFYCQQTFWVCAFFSDYLFEVCNNSLDFFRVNLTCLLLFIALAVFAISPLEMVRTKIQSEQLKYSQVLTAVQHTVKEGGMVKSLYRGFTPTLLRDVPFSGQSKLHIYML